MKAVLLSRDLMFITRIKEVAAGRGGEVVVVKNENAFRALAADSQVAQGGVVLVDLEKCPIELDVVQQVVSSLPADSWRCISFFSHVHVDVAHDARLRGLGEVMPRSKFVQVLPEVFGVIRGPL
jgi:hypothetical protein